MSEYGFSGSGCIFSWFAPFYGAAPKMHAVAHSSGEAPATSCIPKWRARAGLLRAGRLLPRVDRGGGEPRAGADGSFPLLQVKLPAQADEVVI